jgi:hypothetical protein
MALNFAGMPVGSGIAGPLVSAGLSVALGVAAALCSAGALLCVLIPRSG